VSEMGDLDDALGRQYELLAGLGAKVRRVRRQALVALVIGWAATIAAIAIPPYWPDGWILLFALPVLGISTALYVAASRAHKRDRARACRCSHLDDEFTPAYHLWCPVHGAGDRP